MTPQEREDRLARTLDDRRLSRGERRALGEILTEIGADQAERAAWSACAFDLARSAISGHPEASSVLDWLEEIVKLLRPLSETEPDRVESSAYFSPGDECPRAILGALDRARREVAICVFTITDDRLSDGILSAHRRGVSVRIITDDEKAADEGSDIARLRAAAVPVRVDHSPYHMHHKFALFDRQYLLTGSFNWTRTASRFNHENLILTPDPRLISSFSAAFEHLWQQLA